MASTVGICNLALGWLGANLIVSVDDPSIEAQLCKVNFPLLRDAVLEARAWTFATRRILLAPTTGGISSQELFGFSTRFTLPAESIRLLRAGGVPSFRDKLDWVKEKNEVLCNSGVLYIKYIYREVDPQKFSSSFAQTLAARIAADLCIALTENRTLQTDMWTLYAQKLLDAAATDGSQGRQEPIRSDALITPRLSGQTFAVGPYV